MIHNHETYWHYCQVFLFLFLIPFPVLQFHTQVGMVLFVIDTHRGDVDITWCQHCKLPGLAVSCTHTCVKRNADAKNNIIFASFTFH